MNGKITLITPPDFFETDNRSLLFINLHDDDQLAVSEWFAKSDIKDNINIYAYNNEVNITWLLYAYARCDYKFINLDGCNLLVDKMSSYLLARKNSYYKTSDENLVAIYSSINQNRIINIETFLEKAFNVQNNINP